MSLPAAEEDEKTRALRLARARAILTHAAFRTMSEEKKTAAIRHMLDNGLTINDLSNVVREITRANVDANPSILAQADLVALRARASQIRMFLVNGPGSDNDPSLTPDLTQQRWFLLWIELAETEEILRLAQAFQQIQQRNIELARQQQSPQHVATPSKPALSKPTVTKLQMQKLTAPLTDAEVARLKRRERELGERMMKQLPGWEVDAAELNYIVDRLEQHRQSISKVLSTAQDRGKGKGRDRKPRPTVVRLPQAEPQERQSRSSAVDRVLESFPGNELQERQPFAPQRQFSPQRVLEPLPGDEIVDDLAAAVELADLERAVAETLQREVNMFGRTATFFQPLQELQRKVSAIRTRFAGTVQMGYPSPNILLSEYLSKMDEWKADLKEIIDAQLAMGRRCNNDSDPISFTDIADLDDGQFIRLENGDCWEVESLLDFIRSKNGRNDATSLKNAASNTIWTDDIELNRILHHPEAIRSGFTDWFNEKNSTAAGKLVSAETMRRMVVAASLLLSRGPDFQNSLRQSLNDKQSRALEEADGDPSYVDDGGLRLEIEMIVGTTLKSTAVVDFYNYYLGLSKAEKDALNTFDKEFEQNLVACAKGNYCVFGMGDILLVTRNSIAELKKVPHVNLGSRFD